MPTYEYRCQSCQHLMEVFARMSDPPPEKCEECGAAELNKVLHAPAVHYKGSGFYSTDYAGKGKAKPTGDKGDGGSAGDGGSSSGESSGGDSPVKDSGSKPESKPASSGDPGSKSSE